MATTIILYNQLGGDKQTGGTWSRVSSSGPAAPNTYNGSIDFAGTDPGVYVYEYTVTSGGKTDSARVTVEWLGSAPSRTNDTCATAWLIPGFESLPCEVAIEDDNRGECGVLAEPDLPDPLDYPVSWDQGTYSGDLWYYIVVPSKPEAYAVYITVDSRSYLAEGAAGLGIQIFKNEVQGGACAQDTEVIAGATVVSGQVHASVIVINAGTETILRFRVTSITKGKFSIIVKTSLNTC